MLNEGVGSWTARRARKTPDLVAVVHDGAELSYSQLHDRVARLAGALRGLGIQRGERVAFLGPNHPAFLETMFATWAAGGIFVPLNPRLAAPELAHHLADSGTRALISGPGQADVAGEVTAAVTVDHLVAVDGPGGGTAGYAELLATAEPDWVDVAIGLGDPCLLMYTSGTTGRAKGVTLTHGNITWNAVNVLVDTDLGSDAVALVAAPLFHTAALNMLCLPVLLKGGTVVIEPAFDPGRALDLIAQRRITVLFGVPAMYDAIAAQPGWPGRICPACGPCCAAALRCPMPPSAPTWTAA